MEPKIIPYKIIFVLGETWLVPKNFEYMSDFIRGVEKLNDKKDDTLTAAESKAFQAAVDNPYLIKLNR